MKMFKTALFGFLAFSFLSAPCMGAEIHKASMEGDLAKVQALIAENPGLTDAKDEMGRTPLHLACYGGHTELVKLLLAKGADMEAKFPNGSTALFWTSQRSRYPSQTERWNKPPAYSGGFRPQRDR